MPLNREQANALMDPAAYHAFGYPWEAWAKLRRKAPVYRVESDTCDPYWAVTLHEDICAIEGNTGIFKNGPRMTMDSHSQGLRSIVNMDPPEHGLHRSLANAYFLPRNIAWVEKFAEEIVTEALDQAMERNGEIVDLQEDVANLVPTAVVAAYLGVPREMWSSIIDWTNTGLNAADPRISKGEDPRVVTARSMGEMVRVYAGIFADRRANPRDDLMTALVTAKVNDQPLTEMELNSWAVVLTTAGHETTQGTFGAGVHALLQNPDQFAKLKARPDLLPAAIEEIMRYLSPSIHFVRTPDRDVEVRGQQIRAGQPMVMFYPSANRDERAFENPDVLDIERSGKRHLAFGTGPHVCIGQHLARLELRVMFEQFLKRVESIEPAGEPERVFTCATGGFKHFPVRMTISPKA